MIIAELKNINHQIGSEKIVNNVSLKIKKGEITTLIGPNGGGKTSIAKIILKILKPTSGEVKIKNDIEIGYMPQKINIDKTIPLKVENFLELFSKKVTKTEEILNLAKKLNIDKNFKKEIHDLSGGEMQKLMFLMAISNNPELLVLDEPTQYMDVNAASEFYKIIDNIRKEKNCAILLISHDLFAVMQNTDSVFCINNHICCSGTPESVNNHPEFQSLFGDKVKNISVYQHQHNHCH